MFNMLNNMVLGSLPTLSGVRDWVVTEGGNAVAIGLVVFSVFFLFKQQIGRFLGFILVAGVVFFAVGSPESMLNSLKEVGNILIGN
ncbi:TcpD family membrane protein [Rossellomorea yichunensis]|uniref:TcpD family membrane protein n=1 Tax=Rossellomorea yichunensis TaxID=3077331 RepID=UPI0028DF9061|nr:TcpD family membrane protein [Rossellomorea sp. YC4-1]MDT9027510.1 TcpD family membrane protein [Rossellomorea sp. YC4-1]